WMPVAAGMALAAMRRFREGRPDELPRMLMWGFAAVGMASGIFYSLSRGGILSACLSIVVLGALLAYYGRCVGGGVLLAVLLAASVGFLLWLGPEKVIQRIGTLSEGSAVPSFHHRVEAWGRTVPLIQDNLLTGTGLGTFRFAFMRYAPPGEGWWTT